MSFPLSYHLLSVSVLSTLFLTKNRYSISTRDTEEGLVSEISLKTTTRADSGAFVCEARNAFGIAKLNNRILVEEVPDPPFDLKVTEVGSKGLTLKWSPPFTGNLALNKYIIQWKRERGEDKRSTSLHFVDNQVMIMHLNVSSYVLRFL